MRVSVSDEGRPRGNPRPGQPAATCLQRGAVVVSDMTKDRERDRERHDGRVNAGTGQLATSAAAWLDRGVRQADHLTPWPPAARLALQVGPIHLGANRRRVARVAPFRAGDRGCSRSPRRRAMLLPLLELAAAAAVASRLCTRLGFPCPPPPPTPSARRKPVRERSS